MPSASLRIVSNHKDLKVFHKTRANALAVFKISRRIRAVDSVSIRSQMIRAAFSIPTNIVEGNDADTAAEFKRFAKIARNSTNELQFHLENARDLELIPLPNATNLIANTVEVGKMLNGLIDYLAAREKAEAEAQRERKRNKKRER